ncbi:MAG TPA: SRPBCC family protein [Solirubrobacteraceae bacterium]|nr:SRPBCC family protein [Solirubrobacteraceae bacterium]
MARTTISVDAPPERVWAVLADPACYAEWVVGSRDVRDADHGFPAAGTRFHHTVGWGPLQLRDHTLVLDAAPPHRLVLRAKSRPLGTATVVVEVLGDGRRGSRVTLIENAGDALTSLVFNPLTHLLVRGRNAESLRRLKRLAERAPRPRPAGT